MNTEVISIIFSDDEGSNWNSSGEEGSFEDES